MSEDIKVAASAGLRVTPIPRGGGWGGQQISKGCVSSTVVAGAPEKQYQRGVALSKEGRFSRE